MYEDVIDKLDRESRIPTIKKTRTRVIKKDLKPAVDSLIEEKEESTAVIPNISDKKKIKKIIGKDKPLIDRREKSFNFKPPKKKKRDVVWL